MLYGDDELDYETNVAIVLAVHEFIVKDSEILIVHLIVTDFQ